MKKLIVLVLLSLLSMVKTFAQEIKKTEQVTDHSVLITGDTFEGIIFLVNYIYNPKDTVEVKMKRFSPSNEDIILVEKVLNTSTHKKPSADIGYIFSHLKNYHRQYIGYFNDKGEKIIYINCFPVDEDWANKKIKTDSQKILPKWYDTLFKVFDGGRSFWNVTINLSSKKIINVAVNGVA